MKLIFKMLFEFGEKVQVWDEEEVEFLSWGEVIGIIPPMNGEQPIYIIELDEGLLIAIGNNGLGLIDGDWVRLMSKTFYNLIMRWIGDDKTPASKLKLNPEYIKNREQFNRFWRYETSDIQRRYREKRKNLK